MKGFFKMLNDDPRGLFQAFVYVAGSIVVYVLSSNGHIISAVIQAIIVFGTMYGSHCDANNRRDYKRMIEENKNLKCCLFYAEREADILKSLLTDEQKEAYSSRLSTIPVDIDL